jgi:hypothetical protein
VYPYLSLQLAKTGTLFGALFFRLSSAMFSYAQPSSMLSPQ